MSSSTSSPASPSANDNSQLPSRKSTKSAGRGVDLYVIAVWLLIAGYCLVFFGLAADLHAGMRTHKADLGQIDQAVWNSSQGRFLEQTDNGYVATRLTDHVEPILVLISPIFWVWNDVRALLLLQTLFVGVGAWILYQIALIQFTKFLTPKERTQIWQMDPLLGAARPVALALALCYLLAPQLQSALLTEFHAAPLAVPLILCAFWAVERRRWILFAVAALLTAAVKEEMALLAAGLGLWAIWRAWGFDSADRLRLPWLTESSIPDHGSITTDRSRWIRGGWIGIGVTLVCLVWFVTATFVIVPAYASEVYGVAESGYFQRYGALGDSPIDIFRSFFTQPDVVWSIATEPARLDYLFTLLAVFGLLSLLAPEILLLALPVILANLLSAYPAQYYGDFHYSAPLIPYVAVAAAFGTARLWRWFADRTRQSSGSFQHMAAASTGTMAATSFWTNARTALRPLLTGAIVIWLIAWGTVSYLQHGRGPLAARHDPTPITAHHEMIQRFLLQVPDDAAVTATAAVHPHLSHREFVYQFPMGIDAGETQLGNATWALLDVTTNTDMAPGDVRARVESMLGSGWGVVDAADGFLLMAREVGQSQIPQEFYTFTRLESAATVDSGETAEARLAGGLKLIDAGILDWPRWRQSRVTTLWRAPTDGSSVDSDNVNVQVRTPDGELVTGAMDVKPPALVWYPTERWRPGDLIRVTSLPLQLPGTFGLTAASNVVDASTAALDGLDGQSWLNGWSRGERDQLVILPPNVPHLSPFGPEMATLMGQRGIGHEQSARFSLPDAAGTELGLKAWLSSSTLAPDRPLEVWVQWNFDDALPPGWTIFLHLRDQGSNLVQQDGTPRIFVPYLADDADGQSQNDWRQLRVPAELLEEAGDRPLAVVVGLYNSVSGERAMLLDASGDLAGTELEIGRVVPTAPPVPDQSCALLPATCTSQFSR